MNLRIILDSPSARPQRSAKNNTVVDALATFLKLYRLSNFSCSDVIVEGLETGTIRLIDVSTELPCEIYAQLFDSKAKQLNALDPSPVPALLREYRKIASYMANAPEDEVCREWNFVGRRYSYRVYEIRSAEVVAGCEVTDLFANEEQLAKIVAIGITFSIDGMREVGVILEEDRFEFGAEGSGVSGYELYTAVELADEAVDLLLSSEVMKKYKIEIYSRIRTANDGSRYDRLLDHVEGEDPNRPSYSGIHLKL